MKCQLCNHEHLTEFLNLGKQPLANKYPTQAQWTAAMQSFIQNVGPQIQAAGLKAIANIGSGSDTSFYPTRKVWLASLDGAMEEGLGRANVHDAAGPHGR